MAIDNIRSEAEIISSWDFPSPPLVTILCITYNHERYIYQALEGFLKQVTRFPFEIIVHDDASTDQTTKIVEKFAKQYPTLIRPILQEKNLYSKGIKILPLAASYAKGKYIALCEGDDYWIDKDKLQLQASVIERRSHIDLVFHSCLFQSDTNTSLVGPYCSALSFNGLVGAGRVISGDGSFIPTASILIRREVFSTLPQWFYEVAPVSDYFIQVYGAKRGGAYYINKPMCVYRQAVPGSWSSYYYKPEHRLNFEKRFFLSLRLASNEIPTQRNAFANLLLKHAWRLIIFAYDEKRYEALAIAKEIFFSEKKNASPHLIVILYMLHTPIKKLYFAYRSIKNNVMRFLIYARFAASAPK